MNKGYGTMKNMNLGYDANMMDQGHDKSMEWEISNMIKTTYKI